MVENSRSSLPFLFQRPTMSGSAEGMLAESVELRLPVGFELVELADLLLFELVKRILLRC